MLYNVRSVVRFFVNVLNNIIWFVVRSKGAVIKVHCYPPDTARPLTPTVLKKFVRY